MNSGDIVYLFLILGFGVILFNSLYQQHQNYIEQSKKDGMVWTKVIYMGFPMRIDETKDPVVMDGIFSMLPAIIPIVDDEFGWVYYRYEGNYWAALWNWIRGKEE